MSERSGTALGREYLLRAMVLNMEGKAWPALAYAMSAIKLIGPTDGALTEKALALEQLGWRDLARQTWRIVRKRNPGLGRWDTVARAFLRQGPKALRYMERWR